MSPAAPELAAAFLATLDELTQALDAQAWSTAGDAAERLDEVARTCQSEGVRLEPEDLARARALNDRCLERMAAAQRTFQDDVAALGVSNRARASYER